jgi:hypothetical protein
MSGTITKHTDVTAVGLTGIFGVIDAGEGNGAAPDLVTQVFFLPPGTLTCQEIEPVEVGPSQLQSWAATFRFTSTAGVLPCPTSHGAQSAPRGP